MGCWNETCAVTRTPISPGDPVMMIRVDNKILEAESEIMYSTGLKRFLKCVLGIYTGEYNDYGDIENREDAVDLLHFSVGDKNGICVDLRGSEKAIFVHQEVWDEIVLKFPEEYKQSKMDDMEDWLAEKVPQYKVKPLDWDSLREQEKTKFFKYEKMKNTARAQQGYDNPIPTEEQWEETWASVIEKYPPRIKEVTKEQIDQFLSMVCFCRKTRGSILSGIQFGGCQAYDEKPYYRFLIKKTQKFVTQFYGNR